MNRRIPIFLGLLLTLFAAWSLITTNSIVRGPIESLENLGYDLQLKTYLLAKQPLPSRAIGIVDIDDKSLQVEGHWPWPRSKLAALVTQMEKEGAIVIAFDMFFSEAEPNLLNEVITKLQKDNKLSTTVLTSLQPDMVMFDNDKIFADSFKDKKVVLAVTFLSRTHTQNILPQPMLTFDEEQSKAIKLFKASGFIASIPELQTASHEGGFINIFGDSDGIYRRAPLLIQYKDGVYPSLALQAVIAYLGTQVELNTPKYHDTIRLEGIQVGNTTVPLDNYGQALIPFIGKSYSFPYYSATDVLNNKIPKSELQGKIIFVGTSATGLGDLKATAIQNPFPGVEIQATLANGILTDDFSFHPDWAKGADLVLTLILGIITSIIYPYFGPRTLSAMTVLLPVALLLINNVLWEETGLVLSFLIPVMLVFFSSILNMIYGYLFESRRRERLKEMFGQYVPAKHIDEMLRAKSDYALRGEDRDMSVLFADIRNFTSISEGLTAAKLVHLLNTYFTPMTEIIFKRHGTIDKYIGDLIMAFWGAPLRDKNHARHAIQAALEMQHKTKEFHQFLQENNLPEIKIGIGISSGVMSVGDMGSQYRRNYTVLGDNVNLASRIESLTKFYGVNIIVSENTQKDQPNFVFRKLDRVRVVGKKNAIEIFEVLCTTEELNSTLARELTDYHAALNAYFEMDWDKALTSLEALKAEHPHKKIYSIYIERINELKTNPIPENWDGVYIHASK